MRNNASLLIFSMVFLSVFLSACNPDFAGMGEKRLALSRQNQGNIEIVAIQAQEGISSYINGILLASETINQRQNKLLGRTLKVHIKQEGKTFEDTKPTIRQVVANPRITAVLGHRSSSIAIPASVIYERSQVIFITPFATAKKLTGHNFKYVFRMAPNNEIMADQLSSVAYTLGYKRIVTLYARDDLSREIAFLFEDAAIEQGMKLAKSTSFFVDDSNYRPIISQFNNESFDAIFIASPPKAAAVMAQQLREMGIQKPILGSDSLNNIVYTDIASNAAENTIVPSLYRTGKKNTITEQFIEKYQKKYKTKPDHNAAQGYDSVMLLAAAIERAGSTLPPLLSTKLHYMPAWVGVTGIHAFDEYGDIRGKKYFFKVWQENAWKELPALHFPYLISRFTQNQKSVINYPKVFTQRAHDDEHKIHLLELAQDILKFKHVGIIYEDTREGREATGYDLLKSMENSNKITIIGCKIPLSELENDEAERAILACYGKLSLSIDALLLAPYHGINSKLLQRLNNSLTFFKIPAISLNPRNSDPNTSLMLSKRTDIDAHNIGSMQVYSPLLKGLKVHEFSERLQNLPEISVNLSNLQYQGLADQAILDLSPDNYWLSHSETIQDHDSSNP